MHIYKRSQTLTNWLWMSTLSGDEEMVQQDIEWAKKISLQIAEGLFGYTGIEKNEMARMLTHNEADTPSAADKGSLVARKRSIPVIAEDIKTGETFEFSSGKAAAAVLGVHRAAISQIISGKAKSAKGYRFRKVSKAEPKAKARAKAKSVAKPAARKNIAKKAAAPKRAKPAAKKSVRAKAKTATRQVRAKSVTKTAARKAPARKTTRKTVRTKKKAAAKSSTRA